MSSKISQLTTLATPADEDLLPIVDDPSGNPITKKITWGNLKADISVSSSMMLCNYFIYKDGTTYKAVNGSTSVVDFSGTDAVADVINPAIDVLTSGGRIILAPQTEFTINEYIWIKYNDITLEGSGWTTILKAKTNLNDDVIIVGSSPDSTGVPTPDSLYRCSVKN